MSSSVFPGPASAFRAVDEEASMYRNPDDTVAQWLRDLVDGLNYDLIGPLILILIIGALLVTAVMWYRSHAGGTPLSRR